MSDFNTDEWTSLTGDAGPFLRLAFLQALEDTACVGNDSGWIPRYYGAYDGQRLVAVAPGYTKLDSYGEYVFDFSWANAYHHHGLNYYPKWVNAIPYTPVTGPRLLCNASHSDKASIINALIEFIKADQEGMASSLHWLFTDHESSNHLAPHFPAERRNVQFQWFNRSFTCFDSYLAVLTSRKRKDVRKARARIQAQNITCQRYTGQAISQTVIDFFYQCYRQTYLKRSGHEGYLSLEFFQNLALNMADNMLIVIAERDGNPIASALLFFDETGLFGRYWGALTSIDGLHFEVCYYQGIDFAIEQNLPIFNPGTQGEHKILRGFEPIYCYSRHYLYHEGFHDAVTRFLAEEKPAITHYYQQAFDALPFNQEYLDVITTGNEDFLSSSHSHRDMKK